MGWYKLWFSIDAETKYAAIIWDIDSAVGKQFKHIKVIRGEIVVSGCWHSGKSV